MIMMEVEIPTEMYVWIKQFGDPDVYAAEVIRKGLLNDKKGL
jgi:hypothetical protein